MRFTKLFAPTLREVPAEAEVVSQQLMLRAGYMRKSAAGMYSYLPLAWRVLKKIENIVREEMDNSGAQEILMPIIQPKELWEESGRWEVYGKELMRLKDRHDRGMCLGPTHEEVITSIAREGLKSYKQLPVNLYQIQSKFRDEVRPRFGLLRGREFIMKDAYSFDANQEGLEKSYKIMAETYTNFEIIKKMEQLLKVVSDQTRLKILFTLVNECKCSCSCDKHKCCSKCKILTCMIEKCVSEIVKETHCSQSLVSHQLKVLKNAHKYFKNLL